MRPGLVSQDGWPLRGESQELQEVDSSGSSRGAAAAEALIPLREGDRLASPGIRCAKRSSK